MLLIFFLGTFQKGTAGDGASVRLTDENAIELQKNQEQISFDQLKMFIANREENAKRISLECSNIFEWGILFEARNSIVGISLTGLSNDDRKNFLYDDNRLFYKPEIQNNDIDFESSKRWEASLTIQLKF